MFYPLQGFSSSPSFRSTSKTCLNLSAQTTDLDKENKFALPKPGIEFLKRSFCYSGALLCGWFWIKKTEALDQNLVLLEGNTRRASRPS